MGSDVQFLGGVVAARDGQVQRVGRGEAAQLHPAAQLAEPVEAPPHGARELLGHARVKVRRVHVAPLSRRARRAKTVVPKSVC